MIRAIGFYKSTGIKWIVLFENTERMFEWCIRHPSTLVEFADIPFGKPKE